MISPGSIFSDLTTLGDRASPSLFKYVTVARMDDGHTGATPCEAYPALLQLGRASPVELNPISF